MPQFLLAALTGILGFLSFPVYSVDCLIWITLVPLLAAVSDRSAANAFWIGWLTGIVGFCGAIPWVAPTIARFEDVSPITATALAMPAVAYHAIQVGIFGAFCSWMFASNRRVQRNAIGTALAIASAWVVLERSFPKVFPWSFATVLSDRLALIQIVEVTGVWGLSFVIALVNAALAIAVIAWCQERRVEWKPAGVAAVLLLSVWGFGLERLGYGAGTHSLPTSADTRGQICIVAIQGNVGPGQRDPVAEDQTFSIYRQLTLRPPMPVSNPGPALVIWPETTIRSYLRDDQHFREPIFDTAQQLGDPMLIGSLDAADHGNTEFNSLFVVSPARELAGVYHKSRLLPFGESTPLIGSWWRTTGPFVVGESPRRLGVQIPPAAGGTSRTLSLAPSICYEAVFPGFFNDMVRHGAEVLVNITDDSWFGTGNAPWQHLQSAIFRAVETRRPLVRASNSGISAIVAPSGRVTARTALFTRTVMQGEVIPAHGQTLYVRWGDWFPWLCLSYVIICCGMRWRESHERSAGQIVAWLHAGSAGSR